jgi:nucleoside-diphosphate-sugar epimerase
VNDCRQKNQLVVYACTGSVYGHVPDGLCTEQTLPNPESLYADTKLQAERLFLEKGNCISLRIATAFGLSPKLRTDLLINNLCLLALRDRRLVIYEGHARRTFLHVRDIGRAIVHALENANRLRDGAYNCGDESMNLSKIELARRICQFLEIEILDNGTGRDHDRRDYCVSHERWMATGFHRTQSIEDGIRELLAAFAFLPLGGTP